MCYDYKSSIIAWLVGSGASVYMLANPDIYYIWIPLFILTYSQIQILEAFLWKSLNDKEANGYVTNLIPYFLLLQPLVNSYAGYKTTNENVLYYMTIMYILLILYYAMITKQSTYQTSVNNKNEGLIWDRYDQDGNKTMLLGNGLIGILYLLGLFIPLLYIPDPTTRYTVTTFAIVTFLYSLYNYGKDLSSRWCYFVVWIAIFALIFNRK